MYKSSFQSYRSPEEKAVKDISDQLDNAFSGLQATLTKMVRIKSEYKCTKFRCALTVDGTIFTRFVNICINIYRSLSCQS